MLVNQEVNLFADDLSGMTSMVQSSSPALLTQQLEEMQGRAHAWGRKHQVEFDPGKEYFKILHPSRGIGDDFKLVGTLFDCRLTMQPCIDAILAKIRPKVRALLRLQHLYSVPSMIGQYKSHIWSLKEYSNGAILIAAPTQLRRLDKVQRWYLHELGISDTQAFVDFNFAVAAKYKYA